MSTDLSAGQAQIIDVIREEPPEGESPEQTRLEKLLELLPLEDATARAGQFGTLALIAACDVGDADCVRVLTLAGCNAKEPFEAEGVSTFDATETGITPLIAAASGGHSGCIRECLLAGADPTSKTSTKRTALDAAKASGEHEAIRLMREAPHTRAAAIARRSSAYTKSHLGLDRLYRQAIAVHVIDWTDASGDARFVIESEDNFQGERKCYHVTRSLAQFRRLHDELVRQYATLPKASLQNTAPKCADKHSDEAKRDRMRKLEEYLRGVLSHVEQSVGGKYQVYKRNMNKPDPRERPPAELPFELVMFLGLEDTCFPEECRVAVQRLRQGDAAGGVAGAKSGGADAGGADGAARGGRGGRLGRTGDDDKQGCPVQ